jgi:pyridoxine 5'-phosphate synthase PdxJ
MTAATWPKYADTSGVQQITQDMRDNQKRFRPDDVQRLQALIARVSLNPETP